MIQRLIIYHFKIIIMEQEQSLLSSDLQIDSISHSHLTETSKWAKFIAIAGFIFSGIIIIFALYYINLLMEARSIYGGFRRDNSSLVLAGVFYIVVAIIWIITSIYQLRFATKLQNALQGNNQDELQSSFLNFKIYYRISGIVTIVSLLLSVLGVLGLMANTKDF
jgi:hypothetical protein